eukprot:1296506-Amphidinium_carterae.1
MSSLSGISKTSFSTGDGLEGGVLKERTTGRCAPVAASVQTYIPVSHLKRAGEHMARSMAVAVDRVLK